MTKLIDTTVLIYAHDSSDQEKQKVAVEALGRLEAEGDAVVSVQNLAEFARAMCEKAHLKVHHEEVRKYVSNLESMFPQVPYGAETICSALSLSSAHRVHFFDALLAATMKENYISEIITENDRDFARIPGIKATNPFRKK